MKYFGFFAGGPSAPWAEDDLRLTPEQEAEERIVAVATHLARQLDLRAKHLRAHPSLPNVMSELRLQMAEATALDRMDMVVELVEMMMDLVNTRLRRESEENQGEASTLAEAWPDQKDTNTE